MIVIDVETSGVDPRVHSIISIGALEFENPENEFYGECKIWDGAEILDEALAINGFSEANITDPSKQSLEILMSSFLRWSREVENRMLAGHNVHFDIKFLEDTARRAGENWDLSHRCIDTHSITYFHIVKSGEEVPVQNRRSDINASFVQNYVGIPDEPTPHNALTGARVAAEALSRLLYEKPLLNEYQDYSIPWM